MKFTFSWLKEHLDTSANVTEIVDYLNKIGLEVSSLKTYKTDINNLKVAKIIDVKKHPNADKLSVCTIQLDNAQTQVVCGAPNVNLNKKYVFAPSGTYIGGIDITLKKAIIRDVESDGMLCSEKELEISDNHEGIIELPDNIAFNDDISNYLGIDDPVIEIEITPNRGDCLGVRGIARDLSAFGAGELIPLKLNNLKDEFNSLINWEINLPNMKDYLCPSIYGRSYQNVKNTKSPQWMVNRLLAVGLRPISAIVDVTNYVMMDIGRPLHAYDVKKINGNKLTVRISKKDEKFHALNGKTYNLDDSMIVICDKKGVDDLAGIMGGSRTGVDENTTEFFLEAAIFCPISIAKTGRYLNINSDARYRFERGLDFYSPEEGIIYASKLINDICGGSCSDIVSIANKKPNKKIIFDYKIVKKLTGVDIEENKINDILQKLGFEIKKDNKFWEVIVPTWRNDVERSEDLVEEIIRIFGYEKIPTNVLPIKNYITKPSLGFKQRLSLYSRKCLSTRGFNEVITFSFLDKQNAKIYGGGENKLNLVNPISSELSDLRPSIIPNLIKVCNENINRGINNLSLFEVGPIFKGDNYEDQYNVVTGIRYGNKINKTWKTNQIKFDFYDIKSDILAVLTVLQFPISGLKLYNEAPNYYHPGRSAIFKLGNKIISSFGQVNPLCIKSKDKKIDFFSFEIYLDNIPLQNKKKFARSLLKLNHLQPINRDFSFLINNEINTEQLINEIKLVNQKLIQKISVFDIYQGNNIPNGKKSVSLSITIQPNENSLTDDDLENLSKEIIDHVSIKVGAEIRSI